jgi:choline dehydrogenase-like flavoprotein
VWTAHEAELADAFEEFDLKPGHMPIARYKRCMTTGTCKYCPIGARYSAQDHMDDLLKPAPPYFKLKTEAPVRCINVEGDRALGVQYFDKETGDWSTAEAEKVIVCAGTYESTKLLLASTPKGWEEGLGNHYRQVGLHIVTHLLFSVQGTRKRNPKRLFQEYDFPTLMSRSWDTPERQAEGKMFVFNNRSLPKTDFADRMIKCQTRKEIDRAAKGPCDAGLSAFIEEFGDRRNQLTLGSGTGEFKLPKTEISFSRHESASFYATVERAQKMLAQCLESLGYECPDEFSRENPRGDHASGTCRMGTDPRSSVTNGDLAVHGINNLFVCSNAVLPNAAAVNPTLTLAALALRLGARLGNGEIG